MEVASVKAETDQGASTVRWKLFLILLLLFSINYIDRASLSIAMPLIEKEFNLDPATQGLLLSSFFWTYMLMQFPGGWLSDRFKPRIVVTIATVGWGFCQAIAAASTNWWMLLLTRLGLGLFEGPIPPACGKLIAIWMTRNERGRGAMLFNSGAALGAALGSIIIIWLITVLDSWRLAFLVAGVATMLCGYWAWSYIRNSPREHPLVNEAEAAHIEGDHALEDKAMPAPSGRHWLTYFRFPTTWYMCLGWAGYNTVFYGMLTWLPSYLSTVFGVNLKTLGGASFAIFFVGFVGQLTGGWLADMWRKKSNNPNLVYRTMFGISSAVATIALFTVAHMTDLFACVVLLSIAMFFLTWGGMYWVIPAILATRERAGVLGGAMNVFGTITGVVTPVIVGLIVQSTGSFFFALIYFAAAALTLFVCSCAIDYRRRLPV